MSTPTTFKELVGSFLGIINILITVALAIAFTYLVWKIFDSWIVNAGDEKKHEAGKQTALVAVIVIVIITALWGIVTMIKSSFFG